MSDGAITFDTPLKLTSSIPLNFPQSRFQMVAPFLADYATVPGTVRYRVYTGVSDQEIIRRVSSFVRNRGFPGEFVGHWMLVVEWRNLRGLNSFSVSIVILVYTYEQMSAFISYENAYPVCSSLVPWRPSQFTSYQRILSERRASIKLMMQLTSLVERR